MNIMGFKIGKKHLIIIGAIVLVFIIISTISSNSNKKEIAERQAAADAANQNIQQTADANAGLSNAEVEQNAFIKVWGNPPDGFRWKDDGTLTAVSSDNLTNEDVIWNYLRGLSILDFSTVQKYSSHSLVESTYSGYFSDSNLGSSSYYAQFLRKEYKYALTSIEVDSVGNTAVFADGTSIVTVKLKMLDLTDKDFWQADKDTIFNKLKSVYTSEKDTAKAQQYVYDYIYSAYEDGKVGKRDITIELKLDKVSLGGWLVSDDTDLNSALKYEEGVNVASYILEQYSDWYSDSTK